MGLREMKVARTRAQIVSIALDLFIEQGFDETTMEQIAEHAEVGTSTLYRYFPSKDLLILDRFTRSLDFGGLLRQRPLDEPIRVALGSVVRESLRATELDDHRFAELRRIVDNAASPRAKLWDLVAQSTSDLEEAIADRLELGSRDISVLLAARLVFAAYEIAGERWWSGDRSDSREEILDEILHGFASAELFLPAAAD